MEPIIISGLYALRSTFAPGMFSIFIKSIGLTLLALFLFIFAASGLFTWVGYLFEEHSWAAAVPWLGGFGAIMLSWFLFPGIMPVIINFFDVQIAGLIEQQDYPNRMAVHDGDFWKEMRHDLRFTLSALLLNILVLPLYLLMPGFHLIAFYLLNGYLLGREFFIMAARRHMPVEKADMLRKTHGRSVLAAGIAIAVLATIPLINLLAPFWGVAIMVHLYHQLQATSTPLQIEG